MYKTTKFLFAFLGVFGVLSGTSAAGVDHSKFDAILKDVVANERVDYAKVKSDHADHLSQYLDALAEVDLARLSRDEQLAYYINLYNATMIQAVIDRDPSTFKPSDNDFAVFKEPLVRLQGRQVSLNDLENEIIRKEFADARIHAALNCAAVSCPPILSRAYRADDLDRVLDENVRRWLGDPGRNVIDRQSRKLRLSRIFDWYNADFGGPEGVAGWVANAIGDPSVAKYPVAFLEYDWTLNKR